MQNSGYMPEVIIIAMQLQFFPPFTFRYNHEQEYVQLLRMVDKRTPHQMDQDLTLIDGGVHFLWRTAALKIISYRSR